MGIRRWEKRKTVKTLQLLETPSVVIPVRLQEKNETASKVACSRSFSEVDAYRRVSFFPFASGGVSKSFAVFSVFLSLAFLVDRIKTNKKKNTSIVQD